MRLKVFVALLVATFIATCISFTSAENVAQIQDVDGVNNLHVDRKLADAGHKWWLSDDTEERGGGSFMSKMKSKVRSYRASGDTKPQTLNNAQVKEVTKEVATTVKKNRKAWPVIKKGLLILYGTLLAGLIIVGVDAMLDHDL